MTSPALMRLSDRLGTYITKAYEAGIALKVCRLDCFRLLWKRQDVMTTVGEADVSLTTIEL